MELIVNERIESNAEVMNKVKIKNFTNVITGGTPSTSKAEYWENGNIPWLNSGELNQKIVTKSRNHITKLGLEKSSTRLMPKETVLMALTGSTTGVVGYLTFEACANQSVTGILPSEKHIPKYLYHYLNFIRPKVVSDAYGGAQPHISQGYVKELEIPLPSLEQQQKIAEILDTADQLRQYNKQLIAKYDALIQSLFLEMFGDPVRNERGWKKMELGEISDMASGSTPSRTNENNFIGNIPWVKTTEVNGKIINDTLEKISEEALKNSSCRLFPKGSIVIAMYGQGKTRGQIGILGIEAATNQACCVLRPSNKMNFQFLYYTLSILYDDLRSLGRGGNQPNLNLGLLKNYELINPPLSLQTQFAERVQMIETQKIQAQEVLVKSEDLFQSLLQKAFKGELV